MDEVTTEKFQEKVYLDNQTSTELFRSQIVENIDMLSIRKFGPNELFCKWQIKALIQHKSHIHEKVMRFSGKLKFKKVHQKWLLDQALVDREFADD